MVAEPRFNYAYLNEDLSACFVASHGQGGGVKVGVGPQALKQLQNANVSANADPRWAPRLGFTGLTLHTSGRKS
jgi:hypothetical protein